MDACSLAVAELPKRLQTEHRPSVWHCCKFYTANGQSAQRLHHAIPLQRTLSSLGASAKLPQPQTARHTSKNMLDPKKHSRSLRAAQAITLPHQRSTKLRRANAGRKVHLRSKRYPNQTEVPVDDHATVLYRMLTYAIVKYCADLVPAPHLGQRNCSRLESRHARLTLQHRLHRKSTAFSSTPTNHSMPYSKTP